VAGSGRNRKKLHNVALIFAIKKGWWEPMGANGNRAGTIKGTEVGCSEPSLTASPPPPPFHYQDVNLNILKDA